MRTQIEAQVAAILAEVGRIDAAMLTRETALAGLGLDSIVMVEAIFAVEEAFDIAVPLASDTGIATFGALVDLVADLVQSRA
jgi:acyl carrier protein